MEVEIRSSAIAALARRLKAEADGKQFRKDLITDLRQAVAPGVSQVKERLRSLPHSSGGHDSMPLGATLAAKVSVQVRTTGNLSGVRVRIPQTPQIRGFKLAARRLNRGSWRRPVYGNRNAWVTQQSPVPGFFDDTLAAGHEQYRSAVVAALRRTAARLTHG